MDEPINFTYEDTDTYQNEISELYSYIEESEFFANRNAFEESMEDCGLPLAWKHMVQEQKSRTISYLMSTLDVSCRQTRIKSCRALAYLIQGAFGECLTLEEQAKNSQDNVLMLYQHGIFQAFVQQLLIESNFKNHLDVSQQSTLSSAQIYNDSAELRLILSVLCTITETMYHAEKSTNPKILEIRQQFIIELQYPFGDELLSVTLFQMLNNFCSGLAPHYPVKKIILLLWKVILITLGGSRKLRDIKEENRRLHKLEPQSDDTVEVTKNMRPCSPPVMPDGQARLKATFTGGLAASKRKVFKQPAFDDAVFAYAKECLLNSLAELNQPDADNEPADGNGEFNHEMSESQENLHNTSDNQIDLYNLADSMAEEIVKPGTCDSSSSDSGVPGDNERSIEDKIASSILDLNPDDVLDIDSDEDYEEPIKDVSDEKAHDSILQPISSLKQGLNTLQADCNIRSTSTTEYRGLPWSPKVRRADLLQHLSSIRQKFLGYTLQNDLETTFGLPTPIIEGINVLQKHLYVSMSEAQLDREESIEKYPLTYGEMNPEFRDAAAEKLYCALLPRLPQYMIALLKILLAASTNSKNKSDRAESINIMAEINSDCAFTSIIQTMKMNADASRHKEVIIKGISAILLLLLKHFKINHVYQFEYVSQQLMFANCIPLILKFLSQDIYSYIVSSKSTISAIDFPACVIGEQPELTTEAIELCSFQPYCWRNMFSCINLVRILNKLTKWKHSRIMMLVVFKSAPTLAKALSVRHSLFQLYVLKLLKVQLKFLGRQWKKSNMKLISAIYQKVRHRLTDDWAYSNDNEARPWDFQAEEFTLQANINKFHRRRYQGLLNPATNVKSRANSVMFNRTDKINCFEDHTDEDYDFGTNDVSLISPHFERNYERWLESEVFQRTIDWDKLLGDFRT